MPIEVACGKCGKKIRLPDKYAGKRVKCPGCKAPLAVGASSGGGVLDAPEARARQAPRRQSAPPPNAQIQAPRRQSAQPQAPQRQSTRPQAPKPPAPVETPQWHMQTETGEEYGPITRTELDQWYADGRIDATCQILCDGWNQWKWAEEVFPELGGEEIEEVADDNPFAGIGDPTPQTDFNPFASPEAPVAPPVAQAAVSPPAGDPGGRGEIDPRIHRHLAATHPWLLFLSIVGFVGGGLTVLAGLVAIVGALKLMEMAGSRGILILLKVLTISIQGAVTLVMAFLLLTYANQVKRFLHTQDNNSLARAMVAQKTFFMFMGISVAALFALGIIIGVVSALAAGSGSSMPVRF